MEKGQWLEGGGQTLEVRSQKSEVISCSHSTRPGPWRASLVGNHAEETAD